MDNNWCARLPAEYQSTAGRHQCDHDRLQQTHNAGGRRDVHAHESIRRTTIRVLRLVIIEHDMMVFETHSVRAHSNCKSECVFNQLANPIKFGNSTTHSSQSRVGVVMRAATSTGTCVCCTNKHTALVAYPNHTCASTHTRTCSPDNGAVVTNNTLQRTRARLCKLRH